MKAFQFAGQFTRYRSMADRSIQITFETQEVTPELMMNIQNSFQKSCILAVSADNFTSDYLKELENIKVDFEDGSKSPAQRMRGVLFRNWEQKPEGYKIFNDYYNSKMEVLINHFKDKLTPY